VSEATSRRFIDSLVSWQGIGLIVRKVYVDSAILFLKHDGCKQPVLKLSPEVEIASRLALVGDAFRRLNQARSCAAKLARLRSFQKPESLCVPVCWLATCHSAWSVRVNEGIRPCALWPDRSGHAHIYSSTQPLPSKKFPFRVFNDSRAWQLLELSCHKDPYSPD
jgi:hypothetical protein